MEPKSLLGLLIAAAIPVVMFALWAEYFKNEAATEKDESLPQQDEEELVMERLTRIRLAGLIATCLQLVIFLSTSPVREEGPAQSIVGLLVTLAGLVAQRAIQLRLERENLPAMDKSGAPRPEQPLFPSGLFWAFAGMFIYFGILSGCVLASAVAVAVLKLEGMGALGVIGAGALAGYSLALASNFAISPWLFKKMIPSHEIRDPRLQAMLSRCFESGEIPAPEFREIPEGSVRSANAWVTGFPRMTGAFRPVLWLTPRLVQEFCQGNFDAEFEAIIKHEVAHLRLRHLAQRFVLAWSMSLVVLGTMAGSLAVNAYFRTQQAASILPVFSLAAAVALLYGSLQLARKQAQKQELEADLFAVRELGASATSLISALNSIEKWNAPIEGRSPGEPSKALGSHPASADRIAALAPLAAAEEASRAEAGAKRAA
jgi:Zn-dependent protease with chaperone function